MNLSKKLSIKSGLDITIADISDSILGDRIVIHGYDKRVPGVSQNYKPTFEKRLDTWEQVESFIHDYRGE